MSSFQAAAGLWQETETTRKTARYFDLVFAGTGEGRDQQVHDDVCTGHNGMKRTLDSTGGEERRWIVVTSKATQLASLEDAAEERPCYFWVRYGTRHRDEVERYEIQRAVFGSTGLSTSIEDQQD